MVGVSLTLALALAVSPVMEVEATLLDETTVAGSLASLSAAEVVVAAADGPRSLATSDLLRLEFGAAQSTPAAAEPPAAWVELADGSRLAAFGFQRQEGVARWRSAAGVELAVDMRQIRSVVWQPLSAAAEALWEETSDKELTGDLLLINKRQREAADYLLGVVGAVRADRLEFAWEGETIEVGLEKAAAIRFFQSAARDLPPSTARAALRDGSQVAARTLALDQGRLTVESPAGLSLTVPLDEVAALDFSLGKFNYISDMEPALFAWTPLLDLPPASTLARRLGDYRRDASFAGSSIMLRTPTASRDGAPLQTFAKGLAVRSRSELVYRVPDDMRRFQTLAGIDPAAATEGHVWLEVWGDDRLLWEGAIAGTADPIALDLDLAGARRLRLVVDYGDNLDFGDRVHLANARFVP
jgi:hypothetical protein